MLNKYTLSKKSQKAIDRILEYTYRQFGEKQAINYKSELENCLQLLVDNPEIGRPCNQIREGYQRHEHQSHIIFYRQRKNDIFISAIIHKSRDLKRHL